MNHDLVGGARFAAAITGFQISFRIASALLAVILFAVAAKPAVAKSEFVDLKYAVDQSDVIVVASLTDGSRETFAKSSRATLNVLDVLKGNIQVGQRRVSYTETSYPGTGEFIAFIDRAGNWIFTATPLSKSKVTSDVLIIHRGSSGQWRVDGVLPRLISLRQLDDYLKTGALRYTFRGPIWFPQPGQATWKASPLRIEWTYDAISESSQVNGLGKLAGFAPEKPSVLIGRPGGGTGLKQACVEFAYSRGIDRPLEMLGYVEGLDVQSGAMITRFAVTAPAVLTEATLRKYLANPSLGHCYNTYRLRCSPTEKRAKMPDLLLRMHEDYSIGFLDGWGKTTLPIAHLEFNGPLSFMMSSHETVPSYVQALFAQDWILRLAVPTTKGEYLILAFDNGKPINPRDSFEWSMKDPLLYRLCSAPLSGSLQMHDGKSLRTIATFTVTLERVAFAERMR